MAGHREALDVRVCLPTGPGRCAPRAGQLLHSPQMQLLAFLAQDLWRCLDDIDERCRVLEPQQRPVPRDCLHRRLALGGHAALVMTIDLSRPRGMPPQLRFLGAEATVSPLRQRLRQACLQGGWNPARLPRENLEACLEVELPRPELPAQKHQQGQQQDDVTAECCICYSYQLEGTRSWRSCVLAGARACFSLSNAEHTPALHLSIRAAAHPRFWQAPRPTCTAATRNAASRSTGAAWSSGCAVTPAAGSRSTCCLASARTARRPSRCRLTERNHTRQHALLAARRER